LLQDRSTAILILGPFPVDPGSRHVGLKGIKQMSGSNDMILTLVFLGLAVFVIMKLRSVLGTRTGFERPPEAIKREIEERQQGAVSPVAQDNVVPLPNTRQTLAPQPEMTQADRWKGIAQAGTPLASGLDAILKADPSFDAQGFGAGAKAAYEMIVQAYSKGDSKTLKTFLAKDVLEGFSSAIQERESRKETAETTFVSIDKAEMIGAEMREKAAHVTISFASKLISVVRDSNGAVVDGSADKMADVNDIWTFARDVTSRDPNWKLVATESNS
jgi:predicted lipid-binding transport protein (Tim44 family)